MKIYWHSRTHITGLQYNRLSLCTTCITGLLKKVSVGSNYNKCRTIEAFFFYLIMMIFIISPFVYYCRSCYSRVYFINNKLQTHKSKCFMSIFILRLWKLDHVRLERSRKVLLHKSMHNNKNVQSEKKSVPPLPVHFKERGTLFCSRNPFHLSLRKGREGKERFSFFPINVSKKGKPSLSL